MSWPWKFVDLDDDGKQLRRHNLDKYAGYAQISAFGPIFLVLVYRLAIWALKAFSSKRTAYAEVPQSPARKIRRQTGLGAWEARHLLLQWWLGGEVVLFGQPWGRRDEWVFGLAWGLWMLVLSLLETGDDYLHLTKRVGAIGLSQLPLQYLLSLKSLNPIAYVLKSSHEEVNRYHRALGRIIYGLLLLHAFLYLNYFVQMGILTEKLRSSRAVITGIIGIWSMTALFTTAYQLIRAYSYRVFFITHLFVALLLPPLIWFHAHTARVFLIEALVVLLADIIYRKIDTITAPASLEMVPGTNLVKITLSIPPHKIDRFRRRPASHVYLQIPGVSRHSQAPLSKDYLIHEFLYNPFTVAAVDGEAGHLTLVARQLKGPMTSTLKQLADEASHHNGRKVSLSIEGPYGVPRHLPLLGGREYDRILLVSGGIGSTFTVPLYRALVVDNPNAKVQLVWTVRTSHDVAWVKTEKDENNLSEDENVQIYVTGAKDFTTIGQQVQGNGIELAAIHPSQDLKEQRMRPNLRKIVDNVFRHGQEERVAVLYCGPAKMGRDLRSHVGAWVHKGRVVYWHSEAFEW